MNPERKFYCPPGCRWGNIVECQMNDKFMEGTTFTDEEKCPKCPRYREKRLVRIVDWKGGK